MSFLHPEFLWGFIALSIPIIVHLFQFRRYKRVDFSNIKFLQSIEKEQKKQRNIKRILILLSRLLAFTFLILAFAMPVKDSNNGDASKEQKNISIYIDNSLSMSGTGEDGILIEAAKNRAREIVNHFSPMDKFQVLSNDLNSSSTRYINQGRAIEKIDNIQTSAKSKNIEQVLEWQKENNTSTNAKLYRFVLSDFQKSVTNLESLEDAESTYLISLPISIEDNLSIDSTWFSSPVFAGQSEANLMVKITNHSYKFSSENILTLSLNDQKASSTSFEISPKASEVIPLKVKIGKQINSKGKLHVQSDERKYDDELYFSFTPSSKSKVYHINGNTTNPYIPLVYKDSDEIQYAQVNQNNIDFSELKSQNLIILDGCESLSSALENELRTATKNGCNLLIIPSLNGSKKILNAFGYSNKGKQSGKVRFSSISTNHPFYYGVFGKANKEVFDDFATQYFDIQGGSALIKLSNGKSFAKIKSYQNGVAIALSAPMSKEWTDFPTFKYFVPFMLKSATYGNSRTELYQVIGSTKYYKTNIYKQNRQGYIIKGGPIEFIPETIFNNEGLLINTGEAINKSGTYELVEKNSEEKVQNISFNYDRKESQIDCFTKQELEALANNSSGYKILNSKSANFEADLVQKSEESNLWKYCILLTLFFLGLETLLIRLFKR